MQLERTKDHGRIVEQDMELCFLAGIFLDAEQYIIDQAYLMNSSAEDLTDFKSARSNLRKMASFPVCSLSSVIADFAFSSLRAAMYTFALCASNACVLCYTISESWTC